MSNHTKKILQRDSQAGHTQILLSSAEGIASYSDTLPVPTADPNLREGWLYTNTAGGTQKANIYFHSSTVEKPFTLKDLKSLWAVFSADVAKNNLDLPFFNVYTTPTGSGDAGAWYHSRIVYCIPSDKHIGPGEEIQIEFGDNDFTSLHRNVKLEKDLTTSVGDQRPEETVMTIAIATSSGRTAGDVKVLFKKLGFQLSKDKDSSYRHIDLISGVSKLATGMTADGKVFPLLLDSDKHLKTKPGSSP